MKFRNLVFITLFAIGFQLQAQTQIIAHRGFWKTDGSAQNSLTALKKANEIKAYGSELDIWLSSDGIPVVFHDGSLTLNGEKLIIQDTPASVLTQFKLSNGENLPTFEEYLDTFENCHDTKLIIEFKSHKTKYQEDELTEKVLKMIRDRKMQNRVEYISFSLNFVVKTIQLDPLAHVYFLSGNLSPNYIKQIGAAGIDYNVKVIKDNPQWVKECHDLGLKVNVWTVNNPEDIQQMIDLKVDFITTDVPLLVGEMLSK